MSNIFVAVAYDDEYQAQEVRLRLLRMQKEYLIDLEDAVVAVRDAKGKVKLHQIRDMTTAGAISGSFWGLLIGLIFMNPLLGLAAGAAGGAISGALTDIGIDDNFMKKLASELHPGAFGAVCAGQGLDGGQGAGGAGRDGRALAEDLAVA